MQQCTVAVTANHRFHRNHFYTPSEKVNLQVLAIKEWGEFVFCQLFILLNLFCNVFFVQPLSIYGPCHPTLSLAPKRKHDIDIKYVLSVGAEKNDAVANFDCGSEIKAL